MTDLETRLRATYAAVAERTTVAPWSELPDADVVELRPTVDRAHHRRTGWWAAAAAFAVLAGALGAARLRNEPVTAPAGTDRPFAIPMALPTGFGLVDWSTDETSLPGFGEVPTDADVASLDYLGPGGEIHVRSTEAFGDPAETARTETLSTGVLVHTQTDGTTTTFAWVADSGTAVSLSATGVAVDQLLKMADVIWYATPDGFDEATSSGGFDERTFERWQPPGDVFDGSEIRLEGSLQATNPALLSFFRGTIRFPGYIFECVGQVSPSGDGSAVLFGPAGTEAFIVTLPDGSLRRAAAGSPPWFPAVSVAAIEYDDSLPAPGGQLPVTCEEGR